MEKKKKKSHAFELNKHEGQPLGRKGSIIERVESKVLGNHALIKGREKQEKTRTLI